MATPRRATIATTMRGSILRGGIAMAAEETPPEIRDALRELHRADTLARYRIARQALADAIEDAPEFAELLADADREFERRLTAISGYRNEHA